MQSARCRTNQLRKRIDVGSFELGELPVIEHKLCNGIARREAFQNISGSRDDLSFAPLRGSRKRHLFEENFSQLLRRLDIEGMTGKIVDVLRDFFDPFSEADGEFRKHSRVYSDPRHLHLSENRSEWQVYVTINFLELFLSELRAEQFGYSKSGFGLLLGRSIQLSI